MGRKKGHMGGGDIRYMRVTCGGRCRTYGLASRYMGKYGWNIRPDNQGWEVKSAAKGYEEYACVHKITQMAS